jgi:SpoVK/Ycf46/Vps4 family AAA+-type ATPase
MKRVIFPHQKEAFSQLCGLAKTALFTPTAHLPITPRSNVLIVGPSGSGKSFLARAVSEEINVPFLGLSVANWIVLGASEKGAEKTWPAIVGWLSKSNTATGGIIFIDELHHANGDSTWERFLRVEIFSLLDKRLPSNLRIVDDEDNEIQPAEIEKAQKRLEKSVIVGGGAFQSIWNEKQSPIGFRQTNREIQRVSLNSLSGHLPRELINRFRSKLVVLRPLDHHDYESMVRRVTEHLPELLQDAFFRTGMERINEACLQKQGSRFLEELLMDVLIEHRISIEKSPLRLSPENFLR